MVFVDLQQGREEDLALLWGDDLFGFKGFFKCRDDQLETGDVVLFDLKELVDDVLSFGLDGESLLFDDLLFEQDLLDLVEPACRGNDLFGLVSAQHIEKLCKPWFVDGSIEIGGGVGSGGGW